VSRTEVKFHQRGKRDFVYCLTPIPVISRFRTVVRYTLPFFRRLPCLIFAGLLGSCAWSIGAETAGAKDRVITSIKEVRSLSPEEASLGLPVRLRGVVTRATSHEMFIQDDADAIFIWQLESRQEYNMGDYVEMTGTTFIGSFTPIVKEVSTTLLDHRALPEPRKVRYYDLLSGREDCRWVEIEGIVRSVEKRPSGDLKLLVSLDGASLRVMLESATPIRSMQLIGARLRLRGVVGGSKNSQHQIIEPVLWSADRPDTFFVDTPAPQDIFSVPIRPADALLVSHRNIFSGELTRVRGVVTGSASPNTVFVRDGKHGLEIRLQRQSPVAIGDQIEAVGFPEMGTIQPILKNSFARILAHGPPPAPLQTAAKQLLNVEREADLVQIKVELLELFRRDTGIVMVVSEGDVVFSADVDLSSPVDEREIPPVGSTLNLEGICQIDRLRPPDVYQLVTPASFRLHLSSLRDMQILSRPSWWTARRLLAVVALLSAFALGALGWIWSLNQRVRSQTNIILGNVENTAMLEERNRIARELHDTLEQQLAGATILLDAIATIITGQPERARDGLNTARAMLRHSLDEAQAAVSDLRNDDLFEQNLPTLIEAAVRERLQQTPISLDFHCEGTWPELGTVVKKHILRIVQESVTNAIKHASPSRITVVMLAANDRIELQVADNGCGFSVMDRKRRGPGEFGLIGLRERAEKIGAKLHIQSAPHWGTTVVVSLSRNVVVV